jgi:hypothetical protein
LVIHSFVDLKKGIRPSLEKENSASEGLDAFKPRLAFLTRMIGLASSRTTDRVIFTDTMSSDPGAYVHEVEHEPLKMPRSARAPVPFLMA